MRQRMSASSWTQGTPAGLPLGMPGIGLVIDGAMQQAPQSGRHAASVLPEPFGRVVGVGGIVRLSSPVARSRQPA
jgi:hypothetical protein